MGYFCVYPQLFSSSSVTTINFSSIPDSQFVAVGTAKNVILSPRSCSSGYIRVYKYIENGEKLELVHVTPIEGIPNAIAAFQGRLIVGMGSTLRIYDIGKKKLLRKCESRQFPHCITNIKTHAARIIVTDVQESILFCHYNAEHNQIIPFADDIIPRWMTSFVMLDYDTVCGGDKFGNLFVLRLESSVSDGLEEDPMGNKLLFEKGIMNGCAHKVKLEGQRG